MSYSIQISFVGRVRDVAAAREIIHAGGMNATVYDSGHMSVTDDWFARNADVQSVVSAILAASEDNAKITLAGDWNNGIAERFVRRGNAICVQRIRWRTIRRDPL